MRFSLLTTISIGLLSAACQAPYQQSPYQQSARAPGSLYAAGAYSSSEQTCSNYGFTGNTQSFDLCVQRERAARSAGRVNRDYSQALLTNDARSACASYGLNVGSAGYDRCVGREIDARGYRESANQPVPMYRVDQYGNRVDADGNRVDANGYGMARY
jgi:hypothetical protein